MRAGWAPVSGIAHTTQVARVGGFGWPVAQTRPDTSADISSDAAGDIACPLAVEDGVGRMAAGEDATSSSTSSARTAAASTPKNLVDPKRSSNR